jgi:hypothetical protein
MTEDAGASVPTIMVEVRTMPLRRSGPSLRLVAPWSKSLWLIS